MGKKYLKKNVYDAFQERLKYIFKEFDHIYVSFSGGKDSGLLLNMTLDFIKKNYPGRKIGLFTRHNMSQKCLKKISMSSNRSGYVSLWLLKRRFPTMNYTGIRGMMKKKRFG